MSFTSFSLFLCAVSATILIDFSYDIFKYSEDPWLVFFKHISTQKKKVKKTFYEPFKSLIRQTIYLQSSESCIKFSSGHVWQRLISKF